MKIRTKLWILVAVPLIAIVMQGVFEYQVQHKVVTSNKLLKEAANCSTKISLLVHNLQKERGRTAGFLGSKGKNFRSELSAQRTETNLHYKNFKAYLDHFSLEKYNEHYQQSVKEAQTYISNLNNIRKQIDDQSIVPSKAIAYYTNLNDKLLTVIENMESHCTSGSLAVKIAGYIYLMRTKENAGVERAILSSVFSQDKFSRQLMIKFIGNVEKQNAYIHEFKVLSSDKMLDIFKKESQAPAFSKVQKYRDIAFSKLETGKFGVDSAIWFDAATDKINVLKKIEDQINDYIVKEINVSSHEASVDQWFVATLSIVFTIATILVGIACYRSINKPIVALTERMKDIAQGEGDLTQRVDEQRKDELGLMGKYFNEFVIKIQNTITGVAQATCEVASAANEIAATSEHMASSLDLQRNQNSQVAAAVEELSASVSEIAHQTSKLSSHATTSGDTADDGNKVVNQTISQIQDISRIVNEASEQMHSLGERSQAIGMVINVINDIADQTNLLALNAAIEAARAGQHGRGFAVVADEVRKLAERTTTATDEVAQLITAIQTQTQTAIEHMSQGTAMVETGVTAATSAGDALIRIVGETKEVGSLVESIAAATNQQSTATQAIAQSVENISHSSDQSNEAASQAADAALQLSQRAESLQSMINQFKV